MSIYIIFIISIIKIDLDCCLCYTFALIRESISVKLTTKLAGQR
jgi:hypothetical protein